ncbi:hypothetical protein AB0J63_14050 [Streptosporangium canum]|uniref:hypothetical protein n=1 Tax=Streptosporangium canum TaxID=324952 RepID=UPI0034477759
MAQLRVLVAGGIGQSLSAADPAHRAPRQVVGPHDPKGPARPFSRRSGGRNQGVRTLDTIMLLGKNYRVISQIMRTIGIALSIRTGLTGREGPLRLPVGMIRSLTAVGDVERRVLSRNAADPLE